MSSDNANMNHYAMLTFKMKSQLRKTKFNDFENTEYEKVQCLLERTMKDKCPNYGIDAQD